MKINDVLWDAANELLWDGESPNLGGTREEFSCVAANWVVFREASTFSSELEDFLGSLGVDFTSPTQFNEFEEGPIRQGARYLWLDFARLVAEDEEL
jgi:hypothetical protein